MASSEKQQAVGAGCSEANAEHITVGRLCCLELYKAITIKGSCKRGITEEEMLKVNRCRMKTSLMFTIICRLLDSLQTELNIKEDRNRKQAA